MYLFIQNWIRRTFTRRSCLSACDLGSTTKTLDKFYAAESCNLGSMIKQSTSGYWFLFWNALFWSPLSSLEVGLCLLNYIFYILWHFYIFHSNITDSTAHTCRYELHYCCTIITVARSSVGGAAQVFNAASCAGLKCIVTCIGTVWRSNISFQIQAYEWQAIAEYSD